MQLHEVIEVGTQDVVVTLNEAGIGSASCRLLKGQHWVAGVVVMFETKALV